VLACHQVDARAGVAHRLLAVEPLEQPPAQHWMPLAEMPALRKNWLAGRHVVDGRAWTRPEWFARACDWIGERATSAGWRVHDVQQIRTWEFSCVLKVSTDRDNLFFKALPRAYAREVALTRRLADWYPERVPPVLAADARRRWLLLRDCGGPCLEDGAPLAEWQHVARTYATVQADAATHLDRLRALGCADRPLAALRTQIRDLLANPAALLLGEPDGLSASELEGLRDRLPELLSACEDLAASALPLSLDHGDLWASNVYLAPTGPMFIDWTDACITHPFLSLAPLLRSADWDTNLPANATTGIVDAYLEGWSAYGTLERLRHLVRLAEPLAALHTAVAYWRLTPVPHRQWWMPRAVPFFARMALERVSAR
jgi:hypothetical protein